MNLKNMLMATLLIGSTIIAGNLVQAVTPPPPQGANKALSNLSSVSINANMGSFSAGTITGTFVGNLTGNVTGNVSGSAGSATGNAATATALAANGANCSAGQYPLGVDASGNAESCTAVGGASITETNPTMQVFLTTPTQAGWMFTISSGSATVGATYTNNSNTYTVLATVSSATQIWMSGTGATSGGTLTKSTGTGDSTLTFSAKVAYGTYTTPANVKWIRVKQIGGGGGGAGTATLLANAGTGGTGGSTIFGAGTLIATGGTGGGPTYPGSPAGGSCTAGPTGYVSITGGGGQPANNNSGTTVPGSSGGNGVFGGGGWAGGFQAGNSSAGSPNTGGGGGSPGASGNPTLSGQGGSAGGYCEAVIASPAATYAVIIGAGGTAGSNGSGGAGTSAAGGSGAMWVEEHYNY